jgi:hypothetical protein
MSTTTTATGSETYYCRTRDKVLTYCAFRLGDNLAHLHFIRAMAKRYPQIHFQHAALLQYLPQMVEVVADLPNLSLRDIRSCKGEEGINAWKNAGAFWETHDLRANYADFMLVWFDVLAKRMGFNESPFSKPSDLLFDYPALKRDQDTPKISLHPRELRFVPFDFLVVNSIPMSSQWLGMDDCALNTLIQSLAQRYDVITTRTTGLDVLATENIPGFTVTDIGALSLFAERIIMVSTGPSWPTLNVWNAEKFRIVLQDTETLGLTTNTHQCKTVEQARQVLKREGLL